MTVDSDVLEELKIKSDSEKRVLDKDTRFYVEIGGQKTNWYIPMRGNTKNLHRDFVYLIEADLRNSHLVASGLDFAHALYLPRRKTNEVIPREINGEDLNKQIAYMEKNWEKIVEKFYHIIRAYDYSDTLLVTAKIKLVALADEHFPSEQFSGWVFAANEEKTRFLSIELVSYEYSDIYKLDERMYEEE